MKHDYLITNTAYKMLYQASFLQIVYRYQTRRNVQTQNTDLSIISRFEKMCLKMLQSHDEYKAH